MKKMLLAVSYGPVLASLLAIGSTGFTGCKKKEEDVPPAPSAAPPAPTPTPVAVTTEEDAGIIEPVVDAAPDVKKVVKSAPADVAGLRACCTALQQNAASMPPPNNAYALQAASVCQSLVAGIASGMATKAGAFGSLASIMKGANIPPACR